MKYIKLFEDVWQNDDDYINYILTDLHGIFIDLIDDNFVVTPEIKISDDYTTNRIRVSFRKIGDDKLDKIFTYEDISDKVTMCIDYIKSEFKNIEMKFMYYDLDYNPHLITSNKDAPSDDTRFDVLTLFIYLKKEKKSFFKKFINSFK